jgi:hypothetical protein
MISARGGLPTARNEAGSAFAAIVVDTATQNHILKTHLFVMWGVFVLRFRGYRLHDKGLNHNPYGTLNYESQSFSQKNVRQLCCRAAQRCDPRHLQECASQAEARVIHSVSHSTTPRPRACDHKQE